MVEEGPNRPVAQALKLDHRTTAIAVLDLSVRCEDPKEVCSKLMRPLGGFLEEARKASVPILYTISAMALGTPQGDVAGPLKRRESEPMRHPLPAGTTTMSHRGGQNHYRVTSLWFCRGVVAGVG
jgi:hypothetical protein